MSHYNSQPLPAVEESSAENNDNNTSRPLKLPAQPSPLSHLKTAKSKDSGYVWDELSEHSKLNVLADDHNYAQLLQTDTLNSTGFQEPVTMPEVQYQIKLPFSQSNYAEAVPSSATATNSTSSWTDSSKSTFVRPVSNKVVIESIQLIKPPTEYVQPNALTQNPQSIVKSNRPALKAPAKAKARTNVRAVTYNAYGKSYKLTQDPTMLKAESIDSSLSNNPVKPVSGTRPKQINVKINPHGSFKQPTPVMSQSNLVHVQDTYAQAAQNNAMDRLMQKPKATKAVQQDKLLYPIPKKNNIDSKQTALKRKRQEDIITPVVQSKVRKLQEPDRVTTPDSSAKSINLPEISVHHFQEYESNKKKVTEIRLNSSFEQNLRSSNNKTLTEFAKKLERNNVSIKVPSKKDKALTKIINMLAKNNVTVIKLKKK